MTGPRGQKWSVSRIGITAASSRFSRSMLPIEDIDFSKARPAHTGSVPVVEIYIEFSLPTSTTRTRT